MPNEPQSISIAKDFSPTPFGRYNRDGPESGQVFREKFLAPALTKGKVILNIDGVIGLPSSFWEEVMGGLVRDGMTLQNLQDRLKIVSNDDELKTYIRLGWRYAQDAADKNSAN